MSEADIIRALARKHALEGERDAPFQIGELPWEEQMLEAIRLLNLPFPDNDAPLEEIADSLRESTRGSLYLNTWKATLIRRVGILEVNLDR